MRFSKIINVSKHNHEADQNTKAKAKTLRKRMTETEVILWNKLIMKQINGLHFRKQHPFGIYILDFYCDKINLAIEIDGEIHKSRVEYDIERTDYLNLAGIKVIRFTNVDIINRLSWVISEIEKTAKV